MHTLASGHPVRLDNEVLWRKDGAPLTAEYSSFPVVAEGVVSGSVITFSDASVRQNAQKRLAVQYTVGQVLAGSADIGPISDRILAAIGSGFVWDIGAVWLVEGGGGGGERSAAALRCVAVWPAMDAASEFLHLSEGLRLGRGAGYQAGPGRKIRPFIPLTYCEGETSHRR